MGSYQFAIPIAAHRSRPRRFLIAFLCRPSAYSTLTSSILLLVSNLLDSTASTCSPANFSPALLFLLFRSLSGQLLCFMFAVLVAYLAGIVTVIAIISCWRPTLPTLPAPANRHQLNIDRWSRLVTAVITRGDRTAFRRRLWSFLGKLLSANRSLLVEIAPARLAVLRTRWSRLGRQLR